MNTFRLNLDLDKRFENDWVRIRQGDKNGTTIIATIYDHGVLLTGSYTARIRMRLPDGEHFYEKDATFSNGVATVTIDETQAASVSGTTDNAYFQILSGSTVIASTQDFTVRVLRDATSDAEVGENYSTQIQQAIDSLNDMTSTIPEKVVDEVDTQLAAHPEWTTTVQDNSLDDDKLIQKGGILQREQWLETMLPNIPRKATSEADVHSVTDSAGGGPLGISVYGRSTQDGTPTPDAPVPIQSVQGNVVGEVKTGLFVNDGTSVINASTGAQTAVAHVSRNTDYTLTYEGGNRCIIGGVDSPNIASGDAVRILFGSSSKVSPKTFNSGENDYVAMFVATSAAPATDIALYAGSTAYPYVPYNGIGLYAAGRNLWHGPTSGTRINGGITWTYNADGTITANGTATNNSWSHSGTVCDVSLPAGTYTASVPTAFGLVVFNVDANAYIYNNTGNAYTFTLTSTTTIRVFARANTGTTHNNATLGIMLEVGTTASAWARPLLTTIPIDLGGRSLRSLPDGTRDEVTVDEWGHARLIQRVGSVTYDGTENWTTATVSGTQIYRLSNQQTPTGWDTTSLGQRQRLCNMLTVVTSDVALASTAGTHRSLTHLSVNWDGTNNDLTAFKAALAANPLEIVYLLATPVTIDLGYLDPALLPAPDLTAYVVPSAPSVLRYGYAVAESTSSNLAPAETSPATESHAVGTLLTLDGQLVKVTSAIAVGEAVTIGGNVRTTTIAAELAALA